MTLQPQKRLALCYLFAAGLSFWLSMTSLLPVLPAYIEEISPGVRQIDWGPFSFLLSVQSQVGIVMGGFAIGLLLSRTRLGRMADQRGRKIVVLIGTAVAGIAPLGYLLFQPIPLLMALRAFHGISIAAFTTGYSALVVDIAPADKRGEVIGYMSLVVPIGMSMGPLVGGYIGEAAGYAPAFLTSAIAGFLALGLASRVKEEKAKVASLDKGDSPVKGQFWQLLVSPALRVPTAVMLCVGLIFGTLITFLPLFVKEVGIDLNVGLFYMARAIASFIGRLVTGRASDRYGRGLFISLSLVFYGSSMLTLSRAFSPAEFLVAAFLEGLGGGVLIPVIIALVSDRSTMDERGLVYAVCIGGFDLGVALAGPVLGFLAEPLGYRGLYNLVGGIAFFALFIFLTRSSETLDLSLRFATGRAKDVYALDGDRSQ
ncbi:MAG: MFS transporter [Cyanobacteriota bacterium]|nr:MFS transporter [Cyanobacteriota bacterium]